MLLASFLVALSLVASAFSSSENAYICNCQLTNRWFTNVQHINNTVTYVNGIRFYLNSSVPMSFETATWNYDTDVAHTYSCESLHYGSILAYTPESSCGISVNGSNIQINQNVTYCADSTGHGKQCFCEGSTDFMSFLSQPILISDDCRCIFSNTQGSLMFCSGSSLQLSLFSFLAMMLVYVRYL